MRCMVGLYSNHAEPKPLVCKVDGERERERETKAERGFARNIPKINKFVFTSFYERVIHYTLLFILMQAPLTLQITATARFRLNR